MVENWNEKGFEEEVGINKDEEEDVEYIPSIYQIHTKYVPSIYQVYQFAVGINMDMSMSMSMGMGIQ